MGKAAQQNTLVQEKRKLLPGHITIADAGERLRKVYGDQASAYLVQAVGFARVHLFVGPTLEGIPEGLGFFNRFCPVLRDLFMLDYYIGNDPGMTIHGDVVTGGEMRVHYCGGERMAEPPGGWTWTVPGEEIDALIKSTSNSRGAGASQKFIPNEILVEAAIFVAKNKGLPSRPGKDPTLDDLIEALQTKLGRKKMAGDTLGKKILRTFFNRVKEGLH